MWKDLVLLATSQDMGPIGTQLASKAIHISEAALQQQFLKVKIETTRTLNGFSAKKQFAVVSKGIWMEN